MPFKLPLIFSIVAAVFKDRADLVAENMALRHQLSCFVNRGYRPRLRPVDRVFWVLLSRFWIGWRESLAIVKPATVLAWHRKGQTMLAVLRGSPKINVGERDSAGGDEVEETSGCDSCESAGKGWDAPGVLCSARTISVRTSSRSEKHPESDFPLWLRPAVRSRPAGDFGLNSYRIFYVTAFMAENVSPMSNAVQVYDDGFCRPASLCASGSLC